MVCPVCKMEHTHGEPSNHLTRAYILREYRKEQLNGGNATTTALRIGGRYGGADYYHVIHAINSIRRGDSND